MTADGKDLEPFGIFEQKLTKGTKATTTARLGFIQKCAEI
jgi:hypothetical protein